VINVGQSLYTGEGGHAPCHQSCILVNGGRPVAQTDALGNVTKFGYDVGGYRNAGQCSGLQAGGEGPRWEGRQSPSSALNWPVLLLDVLRHDAQWCAADGAGEVRARPEFVGPVVVAGEFGELPAAGGATGRP